MAEKVTAAQKRALEKLSPGEVRTTMGLNSGTLEALEKRALVVRGKAALDKSSSSPGKFHLVEAVAITVAGYEVLTCEEASAEVVDACQKAVLRLTLGAKADLGYLSILHGQVFDHEAVARTYARRVDSLRQQIEAEGKRLNAALHACDKAREWLNAAKAERSEAARQYEALTGLKLLAGPGDVD